MQHFFIMVMTHSCLNFIQRHASKQPQRLSPKIQKILDIWNSGSGVVCLQIFQNSIAVEALTREAAMIDAIGEFGKTDSKNVNST